MHALVTTSRWVMGTRLWASFVIHHVYWMDRQIHCPHLTRQAVVVHSGRLVPGLFICCWWERSCGAQIAVHRERQPSLLWSVCTCVLTTSFATAKMSWMYLCQGKKSYLRMDLLLTDDRFVLSVVSQWALEIYQVQLMCVDTNRMSLRLSLVQQLSAELWCPTPTVPAV